MGSPTHHCTASMVVEERNGDTADRDGGGGDREVREAGWDGRGGDGRAAGITTEVTVIAESAAEVTEGAAEKAEESCQ